MCQACNGLAEWVPETRFGDLQRQRLSPWEANLWPKMLRTNPPKSEMVGRWWCSLKEAFGFMFSNVSAFFRWPRNINVASSLTCGQVHKLNLRPDLACIVVVYFVCFLLILSNFYVGFGHFQKYSWDGLGRRVTTVDSCWSGFMLG